MNKLSLGKIRAAALDFHTQNKKWHFHILSPTCKFNDSAQYVFVLECPEIDFLAAHYSTQAEKELGSELSPLLHGVENNVIDPQPTTTNLTDDAKKIIEKAKRLNEQHIRWHHHVLFPDCYFNSQRSKYVLMLEDPQTQKSYESLSNHEPKDELKLIEPIFYASK